MKSIRFILFILLLFPALCFGDMNPYIAGQTVAGGADCSSCVHGVGDSELVKDSSISVDTSYAVNTWYAIMVVVSNTKCITGYMWNCHDAGNGDVEGTVELYTNSSGEPGSIVSGSIATATSADFPETDGEVFFELDGSVLELTAGTYWMVTKETAGNWYISYDSINNSSSPHTNMNSDDSGTTWDNNDEYPVEGALWGCTQ